MSSSKNKKTSKSTIRPYTVMCTDMYLLWILLVFPLYYADGYFHLPERKATFWCTSTLIYIGVTLLGVIITYISTKDEWNWERVKKNISMTDIFMFGFLISNLIAFALSSDKANSWSGATGRYYGAKVLILVCVSYFLISRYAWVNKVFIWAFLIAGNGVCLLATLDYYKLDVLGINSQMAGEDWIVFISTMGNCNTCASFVCMAVTMSIVYFCVASTRVELVIAIMSIMNTSVALSTCRSDSASVGVAVSIIVLIILGFCGKVNGKRVLGLLVLLNLNFILYSYVHQILGKNIVYHLWADSGVPRMIWEERTLLIVSFLVLMLVCGVVKWSKTKGFDLDKIKNRKMLATSFVVLLLGVVGMLGYKMGILDIFMSGMGMVDTAVPGSRIYIYSITMQTFKKLPFINKVFGNGQSSISQLLNQFYGDELASMGISINSAHNQILDYLIIGGILAVICYLGVVLCSFVNTIKMINKGKTNGLVGLVVIAYFAQACFNIEQTNTTPFFWLFVFIVEAISREERIRSNEGRK